MTARFFRNTFHLRGFSGKPVSNAQLIRAHGNNMASRSVLSQIPALTLIQNYLDGDSYDYMLAFEQAALEVLGLELAARIIEDRYLLQDKGLERLSLEEQILCCPAINPLSIRLLAKSFNGSIALTGLATT